MESPKSPHVKKAKKKQVKDELDRMKQAEKKRRRLEKALATSAAIRSELERKKQLKKEEQQRLDKEGAAIAEAVALHVLLGDDSDDKPKIVLNQNHFGDWHHAANIGLFMEGSTLSHENLERYAIENSGWFPRAYGHECEWNPFGDYTKPYEKNFHIPCLEDGTWGHDDIAAGLITAQAVSSLQIGEYDQVDALFFNGY